MIGLLASLGTIVLRIIVIVIIIEVIFLESLGKAFYFVSYLFLKCIYFNGF